MLSKSCEYAIRAMLYLSQKSKNEEIIAVKEIANATDAPQHFMSKILQDLARKNLVESLKGPSGGFYLTQKGLKARLSDIVLAIDGDMIYVNCVLGLKICAEKRPCPVHHQYKEVRQSIIAMLEENTIASFNEKLATKLFFLK